MSADPTELTLAEAAKAIAARRLSSEEATRATLDKLAAADKAYNSVIAVDEETAIAAAKAADEAAAHGADTGPLHGVPLAHKDMFYRAGRLSTFGSRVCQDHRPDHTATVLSRLDDAGAIDLGRLHMAEFAFNPTGHNEIIGDCRNPWDRRRIPGGSTSGGASALAARAIYGTLGSDTAGSIRVPAAMCGLTGLKPTYGRVSRYGAMPLSFTLDHVGPLARTARDCALLLQAIAGADTNDATAAAVPVPDYRAGLEAPVAGVRIGVPERFYCDDMDADVAAAIEESLRIYSDLGAEIVPVAVPDANPINLLTQIVARSEGATAHAAWMRERYDRYSEGVRSRIAMGFAIPAVSYLEAVNLRYRYLDELLAEVFSRVDILHMPTSPVAAPTLEDTAPDAAEMPRFLGLITRNMRPFNYTGLPAISLPCGFTEGRLPIGMQLVGRPFDEGRLLNLAHLYQRETDWHRRRPEAGG